MTQTARTVLPTDLVALVSYDGRVYANQAMTRDRIGTEDSPHPLETAFEQWFSFATGRHTCVSVKGPTLRGLVSARKRGSKQAWEIDCLIDATEGDDSVLLSLLDQITNAAGRAGAMKLFLRLPRGTEMEQSAARCGFLPYLREQVYRKRKEDGSAHTVVEGLRRREKTDAFPLFQLYTAAAPQEVRRVEGMTLTEWTAAQESLGRTTQYVLDDAQRLRGWLRVAGDGDLGRFDLYGDLSAFDDLLESALAKVANRDWAYTLVPEYQAGLANRLEALGFEAADEFVVLSRRTVRPVRAPVKIPAIAQTTFG